MIPSSAVKDIVRQIASRTDLGKRALSTREYLDLAAALREAFYVATVVWDGPPPTVFVLFSRHTAALKVWAKHKASRPRGPATVLPFATKPGFGRATRALSR